MTCSDCRRSSLRLEGHPLGDNVGVVRFASHLERLA